MKKLFKKICSYIKNILNQIDFENYKHSLSTAFITIVLIRIFQTYTKLNFFTISIICFFAILFLAIVWELIEFKFLFNTPDEAYSDICYSLAGFFFGIFTLINPLIAIIIILIPIFQSLLLIVIFIVIFLYLILKQF